MDISIDRIEEDIAVIELDDGSILRVDRRLFPDCREGDVYSLVKNEKEMRERESRIQGLMNDLFED